MPQSHFQLPRPSTVQPPRLPSTSSGSGHWSASCCLKSACRQLSYMRTMLPAVQWSHVRKSVGATSTSSSSNTTFANFAQHYFLGLPSLFFSPGLRLRGGVKAHIWDISYPSLYPGISPRGCVNSQFSP